MAWQIRTLTKALKDKYINYGTWVLLICSYLDSFCLAMPVTTLFLVLILLNRSKTIEYIIAIVAGTFFGAISGYAIGHFVLLKGEDCLTGTVQWVMEHHVGFSVDLYYKLRLLLRESGFWILLIAAFTPVPYGMLSLSAGLCNFSLIVFLFTTFISHLLKYFILGYLTSEAVQKSRTKIVTNSTFYTITESIIFLLVILSIITFQAL